MHMVLNLSASCTLHLNIGGAGVIPWFYIEDGKLRGSDVLMVELLSEKLGFSYTLEMNSFVDVFTKVRNIDSS